MRRGPETTLVRTGLESAHFIPHVLFARAPVLCGYLSLRFPGIHGVRLPEGPPHPSKYGLLEQPTAADSGRFAGSGRGRRSQRPAFPAAPRVRRIPEALGGAGGADWATRVREARGWVVGVGGEAAGSGLL